MKRRTYIGALSTAAAGAIAGCSDVDLGGEGVTPTDGGTTSTGGGFSETDVQWETVPGPTPARRRFVSDPLGTSDPSVTTEATVDDILTPSSLLANGYAWPSFERISLSDGSVSESEIPSDQEEDPRFTGPYGLADAGILASGLVDGESVTALFDWSLNRRWTTSPIVPGLIGEGVVVGRAAGTTEDDVETTVRAVAVETGETEWETTFDPDSDPRLAIADGTVYATGRVNGEETLLSIDAGSGETTTLWTDTEVDGSFPPSYPVVADGTVYVSRLRSFGGEPPGLWAIDTDDGSVRWRDTGIRGYTTPVVGSDVVLNRGQAYEASDGTVRWTRPQALDDALNEQSYAVRSRLATPNEVILGAGDPTYREGGLVAALSVDDGSLVWRRSLDVSVRHVGVADGRLVVSGAKDAEEGTGAVLVME